MKNTVLTWFYRFICFLIIILYAHTFYQLYRIQFYPISLIIPLLSMFCIYDSFMNKIIESNAKLNYQFFSITTISKSLAFDSLFISEKSLFSLV